jgi:hypothetical protein
MSENADIAAGAIERGRKDAGVNAAVLLRIGCDVRHGQSDFPRFEQRYLDSAAVHCHTIWRP